jgi:hypothetical protein
MATFTSSLPDWLLNLLDEKSREMSIPKNKIIEKALSIYLDQLNRAAYIKSYKQLGEDSDTLQIAEEGMVAYVSQIKESEEDETR